MGFPGWKCGPDSSPSGGSLSAANRRVDVLDPFIQEPWDSGAKRAGRLDPGLDGRAADIINAELRHAVPRMDALQVCLVVAGDLGKRLHVQINKPDLEEGTGQQSVMGNRHGTESEQG